MDIHETGNHSNFTKRGALFMVNLKHDLCDALKLNSDDAFFNFGSEASYHQVNTGEQKSQEVFLTNELGIYELLMMSEVMDAYKFKLWMRTVMRKLRKTIGLKGYEVMRMTEADIQKKIDDLLDTIYYDEETGMVMRSVTVAGGDVEQIPFE